MTPPVDKRKRQLAMIHLAKKSLGLTDDTYRDLLAQVAGVRSAAEATADGLSAVLKHLETLGFKKIAKTGVGKKPAVRRDRAALMNKIEALLADAGRPWVYVDGMAKHMFGVETVAWCDGDQLWRMVAALEKDKQRRAAREST